MEFVVKGFITLKVKERDDKISIEIYNDRTMAQKTLNKKEICLLIATLTQMYNSMGDDNNDKKNR